MDIPKTEQSIDQVMQNSPHQRPDIARQASI